MERNEEDRRRIILTRPDYDAFCDEVRHLITKAKVMDRAYDSLLVGMVLKIKELEDLREHVRNMIKRLDELMMAFTERRKEVE